VAVKIQIEVFWILAPFNVAVGHRRFGKTYCVASETLVSFRNTKRRQNSQYMDMNLVMNE